jgi:GT2 family glycosyltransferase
MVGSMALQPVDQLERVSTSRTNWLATGNDPKFECVGAGFPLRAGWYLLSIELHATTDARLEPMLYFDHGNGMHEAWSQHLRFVQAGARQHRGVVLLPRETFRVRFDPASGPCAFYARGFRLRRVSLLGASWRMWREVWHRQCSITKRRELSAAGWHALRQRGGRRAFGDWLHGLYAQKDAIAPTYTRWLQLYDHPLPEVPAASTLVSILLPTYNTADQWLRRCLDTVLAQTYSHWELCIADDASTDEGVRRTLKEYAARDARIKLALRNHNGHIAQATNTALELATGEFVALLDHDDELHSDALASMIDAFQRNPRWLMAYSDEDKIDQHGNRFDPYFKPDWNKDLLHGQNCFSHFGVYSRSLVQAVGGFREGTDGSQDWDLALRCSERVKADQIGHVPVVLYHWRAIPGSTAQGVEQKNYAHDAGRRVLIEHFAREGVSAEVRELNDARGMFRVRYTLPEVPPSISIIVPTRDRLDLLKQCVESILERSTYPNYEILIVDNQSADPETLRYLATISDDARVRVIRYDHPFNFALINNEAVAQSSSALVCLLNNDIEVITPDWLEEMASNALRSEVGAVGAMLYYPNDTIQHAGVIVGIHGVAGHPYCGAPRGHAGQMARAKLAQSMSAVTAACLMVRREVYERVGGLEKSLPVAFNDVDFCLRLRQLGYLNIWTPFAELYHHESASRGREDTPQKLARFVREVEWMKSRWGQQLEDDPAYNRNFTLSDEAFSLAFPPRQHAWTSHLIKGDGCHDGSPVVQRSSGP